MIGLTTWFKTSICITPCLYVTIPSSVYPVSDIKILTGVPNYHICVFGRYWVPLFLVNIWSPLSLSVCHCKQPTKMLLFDLLGMGLFRPTLIALLMFGW